MLQNHIFYPNPLSTTAFLSGLGRIKPPAKCVSCEAGDSLDGDVR